MGGIKIKSILKSNFLHQVNKTRTDLFTQNAYAIIGVL